jgi:hypothetical protein
MIYKSAFQRLKGVRKVEQNLGYLLHFVKKV